MPRLSFGEIAVIVGVLVLAFGARARSVRQVERGSAAEKRRWSPGVVAFVFAILLGGGFFFVRGIGLLLRMMKK